MEQPEDLSKTSAEATQHGLVVAQATGVVLAQFALSPEEAFEKLTAEAAYQGRPVSDVAREIVQHRGLPERASESA